MSKSARFFSKRFSIIARSLEMCSVYGNWLIPYYMGLINCEKCTLCIGITCHKVHLCLHLRGLTIFKYLNVRLYTFEYISFCQSRAAYQLVRVGLAFFSRSRFISKGFLKLNFAI